MRRASRFAWIPIPLICASVAILAACAVSATEEYPADRVTIAGKDYPTVTIGGTTWTASNYAGPGGIPYRPGQEKPEYGRYYTLAEVQGIELPSGWRIPTREDYVALAESQGVVFSSGAAHNQAAIGSLLSTTHWANYPGNNSSGFNAYPAGTGFYDTEPLDGDICEFWTITGVSVSIQEAVTSRTHRIVFFDSTAPDGWRFNVRFVKDH